MKPYLNLTIILLSVFITACSSLHQTHKKIEPSARITHLQLDAEIHQLLQLEMQSIQTGMMSLVPAIASGDWDKIAETGKNIEESYLLKQQLTTAQRHVLHKSFPAEFIKQDLTFHRSAGMLAHAAEMKNAEIVNFYFYKLNTACVECHTEFAAKKFPMLVPEQNKSHH
ncbi:hypothetical protein AU255_17820 [Methyloprofundus sedimenti]|uniref:Cytochrome C n=1 Tax=Methyloprofundus sedimenti TaxID=1420851 RepID=A0A1V8M189_9GAMM|nr:hypothetical protein [Methyloprofundus sedimenti]OQK15330.1 hypothetical protein AU255_17820 [Methyloprofundus sedimenti]